MIFQTYENGENIFFTPKELALHVFKWLHQDILYFITSTDNSFSVQSLSVFNYSLIVN